MRNKIKIKENNISALRRKMMALSTVILGVTIGAISIKKVEDFKVKSIVKEMEEHDYLLDSYGTIASQDLNLSKTTKKVFSKIDFTFLPVIDDKIENCLIEEASSSNKKIGLVVTPTDYTYSAIYKTIDKVKEIIEKNNITCPILYDISKYMDNDTIKANCLLAEEFCNKLSANGCYVGLAGNLTDMKTFSEKFIQVTETHSIDLYDKMIYLEDNDLEKLTSTFNSTYNMVMLKDGVILWKYNLSTIIETKDLNTSNNFIDEYSYTIKSGDCLSEIAHKYNMNVEDLAIYNNIDSNQIYAGDKIIIPNNYIHIDTEIQNTIVENKDGEEESTKKEEKIESESLNSILKGIDVSYYQGNINWDLVKQDVDFVILRLCDFYFATDENNCSLDEKFIYNIQSCEEKNIPIGVYYFSRATNEEEARNEAKFVAAKLKEYSLEYPVYMDVETSFLNNLLATSPDKFKTIAEAAMKTLEDNGYFAGIYCNRSYFENIKDLNNQYTFWLTSPQTYSNKIDFKEFNKESFPVLYTPNNNIAIYQYSQYGNIAGINGNVDINYATSILPKVIEENGFSKVKK